MNQHIEDYLAELVAAIGEDIEIFTGTSADVRTPENHGILVMADHVDHVVGDLYKANVKIAISSPAESNIRQQHSYIVDDVADLFSGQLPSAESFGITQLEIGGFHITTRSTGVSDDSRWITSLEAIIGIYRKI